MKEKYIKLSQALEVLDSCSCWWAHDRMEAIPAADVRPVVRGKWIDRDDDYYGWNMWACSACGEEFVLTEGTPDMNDYHFCPNCGAWMEE